MAQAITELPGAITARRAKIENLASRVTFRFIDHDAGRFRAHKEGARKADRIFDDLESAVLYSLPIAERAGSTLVIRSHRDLPTAWYSP